MKKAPWSDEDVVRLNVWQDTQGMRFTCGSEEAHRHKTGKWPDWHCRNLLIATNAGWVCPECDYTQNWAYEGMFYPPINVEKILFKQLFDEPYPGGD